MRATAILWTGFVLALEIDGTWARLGADVVALSAFACGFALLAYALDADARSALERLPAPVLLAAAVASVALAAMMPPAVSLLVVLPMFALASLSLGVRCRMHLSRFVGSR